MRCLTPKRLGAGQLYSEGARGTPSGTRRARDKLISVFSCNKGAFPTLFLSLAPPRNAKVGRAGLMKAARMAVDSHSLNMDSTSSSGPGPPAARSISRLETASPSAGFSYDAFRLGVSCRLAQSRRLSA